MKCNLLNDYYLSLSIDGKLPDDIRLKLERHAAECPVCRRELLISRQLATALNRFGETEISPSYDFEFRRKLAEFERGTEPYALSGKDMVKAALDEIERRIPRVRVLQPIPVLASIMATILLVLAVSLPIVNLLQPVSPRIVLAEGAVEVYNPKTDKWINADIRLRLAENSLIRTGQAAKIDIEARDRYKMRIDENSEIELASLTGKKDKTTTSYKLNKGIAIASTGPNFKGSKLQIVTPVAQANVYGTRFLVDAKDKERTTLAVLEGEVEFRGCSDGIPSENYIIVKEGSESTVLSNQEPSVPEKLRKENLLKLLESHSIGTPGRILASKDVAETIKYDGMIVALIMPETPNRAEWFLTNGQIWTNDKEPKPVNKLIGEVERLRLEGIKERDQTKFAQGVTELEKIVADYPDYRYDPQVLFFIGAWCVVLREYDKALDEFNEVLLHYEDTEVASIAQYLIGIVQEEKLKDKELARQAYYSILTRYPDSPEAIEAKNRIVRLDLEKE